MKLSTATCCIFATVVAGMLASPPRARADDIDIFIGNTTNTADAPNVVFLLDNSANWSKASQHWPDQPTQGQAEVDAIIKLATKVYRDKQANVNVPAVNFGVAMLNSGSPTGGYMRFAARDITNLANLTAFANILGYGPTTPLPLTAASPATSIYNKVNDPTEKINESSKDEDAGLYEVFKYFSALRVYAGAASANQYADWFNNNNARTAAGQGLPAPYALKNNGQDYISPSSSCSKQYIIYISNNSNGNAISKGQQSYEAAYSAGTFLAYDAGWPSWTPAWVRFLTQHEISTYILDAFNAQQNTAYSNSLFGASKQAGPNHYYQVGSEDAILAALTNILVDIQSQNSAFAATTLPASSANRSTDLNQVFLGVFRPDPDAKPRWYGNLKRYQVILNNNEPDTGDANAVPAIDSTTGFVKQCAASYWTADTSAYQPTGGTPPAADAYWGRVFGTDATTCPTAPTGVATGVVWSPLSDLPDGPSVEKGGAAEVLRQGNTNSTKDFQVHRVIKTLNSSGLLADFNSTTAGTGITQGITAGGGNTADLAKIVDFASGWDSNDENTNFYTDPAVSSTAKETRPSIHGDVIHSTPLPVTYNDNSNGVVVYYGSDDGFYHAVNSTNGKELWSFVAPEFFPNFYRQYANSPLVLYPSLVGQAITPAPMPKDYGFDGGTGIYQSIDNSKIWIYPSMRRGGRMIYAFDVSPTSYNSTTHTGNAPTAPTLLWKAGCPNLANDTGCTTSMSAIGQTWSKPVAARIKNGAGDTTAAPLLVFGGGYDSTPTTADSRIYTSCEDRNSRSPSCSSRKGNVVYIVDAQGGPATLLKTFTLPTTNGTPGSIAGDVTLLDIDRDGFVDYAYLADTNGFVYRIDFVDGPGTRTPLASSSWAIRQIAGTTGSGRKFLFGPAVAPVQDTSGNIKMFLSLGTGDREHPLISQYPYTSPVTNRFYTFIDDPLVNVGSTTTFLNLDGSTMEDATTASCSEPSVLPGTSLTLAGWYKNLNQHGTGEQTVSPALILTGRVFWNTNRPVQSLLACSNTLGEARGYAVDLLRGSGAINASNGLCGGSDSNTYADGGLPPPPTPGIVPVPTPGGGSSLVGVCFGCADTTGGDNGSAFRPGNSFGNAPLPRSRVYWFTPNYN
jgi:type IV pilus assembly protein PilY1